MYDSEFYNNLKKPKIIPKGKVFRFVWGVLYSLMAVSLFLVVLEDSDKVIRALIVFGVQLGLNVLWPLVFFKYQKIGLALFVSVLLVLSVLVMLIFFFDISKLSGVLQIPYFLWCCFAVYLNGSVLFMNK